MNAIAATAYECRPEAFLLSFRYLVSRTHDFRHDPARFALGRGIREVCVFRNWPLHALEVFDERAQAIIATTESPDRLLDAIAAWTMRRLHKAGHLAPSGRLWCYLQRFDPLWDHNELRDAVHSLNWRQPAQSLPEPEFPAALRA